MGALQPQTPATRPTLPKAVWEAGTLKPSNKADGFIVSTQPKDHYVTSQQQIDAAEQQHLDQLGHQLKELVEKHSLNAVLFMLTEVCQTKADYCSTSNRALWQMVSDKLDSLQSKLERQSATL